MAPKRKAPAANARPSKRIASGVSTPVSIGSDDDFSGSEANESSGREGAAPRNHKYDGQWLSVPCAVYFYATLALTVVYV